MVKVTPKNITIAITVYDRKTYLRGAIRSALAQNTAEHPNVIVVEDCGPDEALREAIIAEFGDSIEYVRNPTRRGLFDNWNACIAASRTPWLCILHDDDFLEPTFIASMIELAEAAPNRALYFGLGDIVDTAGRRLNDNSRSISFAWRELDLDDWARYNPVCFPGQLFNVAAARALGGFRAASRYCADWEMWFKLALTYGSAVTNRVVANYREHHSIGRGTTAVDISGRKYAYENMQRKRHVAWMRKLKPSVRLDRRILHQESPIPIRFLLRHGYRFSSRMLRYNAGLLHLSGAPHRRYRLFQLVTRLFTWRSLRVTSLLFQLIKH
jgi:glycosyltransferase involved in cell wall biosynthesis